MDWEFGISRYKRLQIEWKNNKVLLYSTGSNTQYSVIKQDEKGYREQDGRGVGGHGVHLSLQIHQEYTFRHSSACRTAAVEQTGVLEKWKRIFRTMQNSVGGKTGLLVELDLPLVGGGTEAGIRSPQWSNF